MTEDTKNLSRNSLITFVSRIIMIVVGILSSIILARVLGPSERGVYALIFLFPAIFSMIGSFGVGTSNTYFTGSRKYKINDIVSNSLIFAFGMSFIVILFFWGATETKIFQQYLLSNKIPLNYLWWAVLLLPILLLSNFLKQIILGKEKIKNFNKIGIFEKIFELFLIILLLIILNKGLFGAVISFIFTALGVALIIFLLVRKMGQLNFSFNSKLMKESIKYGGKAYIGDFVQFLNYRLDMFLVAWFLAPVAVGYYVIAVGLAERIWLIPGSIGLVLFPRVSSVGGKRANLFTPKIARNILFSLLLISIPIIFLVKPFVGLLYGINFLPSVTPFLILLPGIIVLGFAKILASDLAGRGKPEFCTYSALISLAINIPLNIVLIPKWGISGAAFASSVAYLTATIVLLLSFLKLSKSSWRDTLLIKKEDLNNYLNLYFIIRNAIKTRL